MKVQISGDRTVIVGCKHSYVNMSARDNKRPVSQQTKRQRATYMWVKVEGSMIELEVFAACSRNDNFNKLVGRNTAIKKLVTMLHNAGKIFTRHDRQLICQTIYPITTRRAVRTKGKVTEKTS